MVQEHLSLPHGVEHVRRGCALHRRQLAGRLRDEPGLLEVGAVQAVQAPQRREVEQTRDRDDLRLLHAQLGDEQVEHVGVDRGLDLQPDRGAEPAPHEFPLQGLEEVLGIVLLHLQVLVARDPERVVLQDLHAGEQLVEVDGDDVLQRDEALRPDLDEAVQQRRHLHAREQFVAGLRVAHHHGEVQAQSADVGKRMRGVDRQRRQDRVDPLLEDGVQPRPLLVVDVAPEHQLDACFGQLRHDLLREQLRLPVHEIAHLLADGRQDLCGGAAGGGFHGDPGGQSPLQSGHADHEELIEVAGEDGEELRPVQRREIRVLRQLQHALVELQPGQLPVVVAMVGQRIAVVVPLGGGTGRCRRLGVQTHAAILPHVRCPARGP